MIEALNEYYDKLHPGRSNFKTGKIPDTDELISRINEIDTNIRVYLNNPIHRTSDFYDGYINGISDSLVSSGWDLWLVHSFIHMYLTIRYTSKYLTNDINNWYGSLSKALSKYYDDESVELIMNNCGISPEWTN